MSRDGGPRYITCVVAGWNSRGREMNTETFLLHNQVTDACREEQGRPWRIKEFFCETVLKLVLTEAPRSKTQISPTVMRKRKFRGNLGRVQVSQG